MPLLALKLQDHVAINRPFVAVAVDDAPRAEDALNFGTAIILLCEVPCH